MKRIAIITRDEPFFVPTYLSRVVAEQRDAIVDVFISKIPSPHLSKHQLFALCGPAGFIRMGCDYALRKLLGQLPLRRHGVFFSVNALLRHNGLKPTFIADKKSLERALLGHKPDIILSVANSIILSRKILDNCGIALNVHGSLLPEYRGTLTAFWMLKNRETTAGVTIHRMLPRIDAGEIYGQKTIPVAPEESIISLYAKIALAGSDLIADTIANIDSLRPTPMRQDNTPMNSTPTDEEIREFKRSGKKFI